MTSRVFFYGTCLIDLSFPDAGMAAVQLLEHAGYQVQFPDAQTCCGQPPFNSGYPDAARDVLRPQLDAFAGTDPILVPSASCAGMLTHQVPQLFADTPDAKKAEGFASRVVEVSSFLASQGVVLIDQGPPTSIALHLSCSAQRGVRVAESMRALVAQLSQVRVLEPERAYECCGFGGTFAVKQPEISAAMAKDKADSLRALGADRLISNDSGCLLNLSGTQAYLGHGLTTQHLYSFLWERVQ